MKKILLKSVMLNNVVRDILVSGNRFEKIAESIDVSTMDSVEIVDCRGYAIFPPFYNAHSHAPMTLLRGYADDMDLFKWLQEYIWPFEAKLTDKAIEVGSRLAVLEMIKSGTTFFADMYWHRMVTMKVVEEMGLRATIGVTIAEKITTPQGIEENLRFLLDHTGESDRIKLSVMPHSVYMVSEGLMKRCVEIAKSEHYVLNTHLSETKTENQQCLEMYGCTPAEFLQRTGATEVPLVTAHCVHLTDSDRAILKEANATMVLNPCSNLKLSSGVPDIPAAMKAGLKLAIGTDGASSNNNLDMREEMKLAALLAKVCPGGGADTLSAEETLTMATRNGALAFGLDAGVIAEGKLADALLVNLDNERMVPNHHLISNWVYAADSSAIDSVMCDGKFVMRHRHVDGEEDIIRDVRECIKELK